MRTVVLSGFYSVPELVIEGPRGVGGILAGVLLGKWGRKKYVTSRMDRSCRGRSLTRQNFASSRSQRYMDIERTCDEFF